MTIAGHTFIDTPEGRLCRDCGKLWVDVALAHKEDINHLGWAHQGALTEHEYQQIEAERDRLWNLGKGA